ncbi:hypothetical protein LAD64_27220 [Klebsiella pneumoniae]|nr:hypothetical protein [Klebsiella pneumoniae]
MFEDSHGVFYHDRQAHFSITPVFTGVIPEEDAVGVPSPMPLTANRPQTVTVLSSKCPQAEHSATNMTMTSQIHIRNAQGIAEFLNFMRLFQSLFRQEGPLPLGCLSPGLTAPATPKTGRTHQWLLLLVTENVRKQQRKLNPVS